MELKTAALCVCLILVATQALAGVPLYWSFDFNQPQTNLTYISCTCSDFKTGPSSIICSNNCTAYGGFNDDSNTSHTRPMNDQWDRLGVTHFTLNYLGSFAACKWRIIWDPVNSGGGVELIQVWSGLRTTDTPLCGPNCVLLPGVSGVRTDIVDVTAAMNAWRVSSADPAAPSLGTVEHFIAFKGRQSPRIYSNTVTCVTSDPVPQSPTVGPSLTPTPSPTPNVTVTAPPTVGPFSCPYGPASQVTP